MSSISLSQIVIPTFTKGLKTLDHIINRAEQHAKEKGLDPNVEYPGARLVEDMNPLTFQVQNATTTVRKTLSRLTGQDIEAWTDDERTIADLHKRIGFALSLLESVDAKQIDDRADHQVELPFGNQILKLSGKDTALSQGLPNFFFHLQTAYAILRAKGVPIGKTDYLSSFLAE
ncbi:hypothetical protein CONLIGDRAFT_496568 [Coniochaeta ligniaria NRRL 30616]|uniref:Uncharacterized protein n=1 Tax=Coniochaeta ligniaria NRRL 30616 TaxID=1408157 RepID=A0A1J7II12_9PEZI|nr:hypothetical protein CONLIGDRAFT_496568 [Coniochaeta ligniaria NRRL 30616]